MVLLKKILHISNYNRKENFPYLKRISAFFKKKREDAIFNEIAN